ncbi:MAG: hypothetical protein FJ246_00845 [Nitrospira sp.]|nr:hypothetical protein [Nitrospira sp.]
MVYALFIYGINIPGGRRFSHKGLLHELEREGSPFNILGLAPHGDTLVIRLLEESSPKRILNWVVERIDRSAVLRPLGVMLDLYEHAISLVRDKFGEAFNQKNSTVTQHGISWEVGVVFTSLAIPVEMSLEDTRTVKVLGRHMDDTVVVLKREKRSSGKQSRIMWGKESNKVIAKPLESVLGAKPVCTSRAISAVEWLVQRSRVFA